MIYKISENLIQNYPLIITTEKGQPKPDKPPLLNAVFYALGLDDLGQDDINFDEIFISEQIVDAYLSVSIANAVLSGKGDPFDVLMSLVAADFSIDRNLKGFAIRITEKAIKNFTPGKDEPDTCVENGITPMPEETPDKTLENESVSTERLKEIIAMLVNRACNGLPADTAIQLLKSLGLSDNEIKWLGFGK